jgi:hypothetical protein
MRKLRFFASAACLLTAIASTTSAQIKIEESPLGPFDQSIRALSQSGLHMAIKVP